MCNKSHVPGVFSIFPVISQDKEFAGRHAERPEVVAVPILFILLVNGFVPHAGRQDISYTRQLTALYVPVFQGDVDSFGIRGNGVGRFPVVDDAYGIFLINFVDMFQGQGSVCILSVDVQDSRPDFDSIAGKTAKPVSPDGRTVFSRYGPVAAIFKLFGFYQIGREKEPARPEGWQVGGVGHRKKLERMGDSSNYPKENGGGYQKGKSKRFQRTVQVLG